MKKKVQVKQKMSKEQEKFLKEVDKLISNLKETGHYWEDEDFAFQFPKKRFDDGSNYEYGHIHIWDTVCPLSLSDDDERPSPLLHIYIKEDDYEENGYSFCYYIRDSITYDFHCQDTAGMSKITKTTLKEMIRELNRFARKQYKEYKEQYA
jgi:hypothetical protein